MRRLVSTGLFLILLSLAASAQDFRTSYFLQNYLYDYRLNPAFHGDSYNGFIGIGISNVTVSAQTTYPLSPFIFRDAQGNLTFGYDQTVSIEKLQKKLPKFGKANLCLNENIFSSGWVRRGTAGSFEVNLRSYSSGYIDLETVKILANGLSGIPYSVESQRLSSRNWLEVAYGFGHSISDRFSFGARIKGLIGLNYSLIDDTDLILDSREDNSLYINGYGEFISSNHFLHFPSANGQIGIRPDWGHFGIGGIGAAIDLGIKVVTERDLEISVSILDLGGLLWKNSLYGQIKEMDITGISDAFTFTEVDPSQESLFVLNPITVEAGVRSPINELISVGTLATLRIDETARGWYELRVGGAFSPSKMFSVAASAAMNTLGAGIGAAMNVRFPGISFFVGTDSILPLFFLEKWIPNRRINTALNAGLSIAW